jgi:hypothetical protein
VNVLVQSNRQEVAHALLTRYPQGWQGGVQAASNPVEPDFGPGPYGYGYRRPFPRYRRW